MQFEKGMLSVSHMNDGFNCVELQLMQCGGSMPNEQQKGRANKEYCHKKNKQMKGERVHVSSLVSATVTARVEQVARCFFLR